jgi:hypothetical protein
MLAGPPVAAKGLLRVKVCPWRYEYPTNPLPPLGRNCAWAKVEMANVMKVIAQVFPANVLRKAVFRNEFLLQQTIGGQPELDAMGT